MKIGVAGFGFVGQAVYGSLNQEGRDTCALLDPPKKLEDVETLLKCEVIFCCLPTPTKDGFQDFSYYKKFFELMMGKKYGGTLIIKSTVLYKNLEPFVDKLNLVSNPEFLNQNTAEEDFINQHTVLLGGRRDLCQKVADVYERYFNLSKIVFEYCTLKEAVEFKYIHNIYHIHKALFWNYVHEVCGNHRKMASLYHKIVSERNELSTVAADGKLGVGGSCFPKDLKAFQEERPHELTKFLLDYNEKLRNE